MPRAANTEYAPRAIYAIYTTVKRTIPGAVYSGIVGNAAHHFGYHRARAVLPSSDYSVQADLDHRGDNWAASALDISYPPAMMRAVSGRLMAACLARDPRLRALREWFGTLDGRNVTGYSPYRGRKVSSDTSHLWHVHLSIFRAYANDTAELQKIAEVIAGKPLNVKAVGTYVVRPASDSVWDKKTKKHGIYNVRPNGKTGALFRPPGFRVVAARLVTKWGHHWAVTRFGNMYRLDYLRKV